MNEGTKSVNVRDYYNNGYKEGFQKGKLEQKKIKRELFWVYTNILEDFGEWDKIEIEKRIKQLQKEIGKIPDLMECNNCRKVLAYNETGYCSKCLEEKGNVKNRL